MWSTVLSCHEEFSPSVQAAARALFTISLQNNEVTLGLLVNVYIQGEALLRI